MRRKRMQRAPPRLSGPPSPRSCRRRTSRACRTHVEREDLGRVEKPVRVERQLEADLLVEIGLVELRRHQVALLDADAVLAGEAAAGLHAQRQNLEAAELR